MADLPALSSISSIQFSSDGNYLAVGSNALQIWRMGRDLNLAQMSGNALVAEACSRLKAADPLVIDNATFKRECAAR